MELGVELSLITESGLSRSGVRVLNFPSNVTVNFHMYKVSRLSERQMATT